MNKFRKVAYTSDGCSEYQCLCCKSYWEARTRDFLFCPFCGTKFLGTHAGRPHETPRWAWDRWGEDIPTHVEEAILASEGQRLHVTWEMQSRYTGGTTRQPNDDVWNKEFRIVTPMCSGAARWRKKELLRERERENNRRDEDDDWHVETYGHKLFRYVIVKP